MPLEINAFIRDNPDWEEKLDGPPYYVKAKREDGFVLLKYSQIKSDFTLPLVRECRGVILDESAGFSPVCVPFFKFGNFAENYVPEIDWPSARVQEKLDGSLIKLWHCRGEWHVSSNGEIDARKARVHSALLDNAQRTDLHALFMEAWGRTAADIENLDKGFTYMFELTSPHNKVIVKYRETEVWHIGTRDNRTLAECDMDIGVKKPRMFSIKTLAECVESAQQLGDNEEGYVVLDKNFNRIKVKSPRYVELSHLSSGMTTWGRACEIVQKNEQEEFIAYFPEFKGVFDEISHRFDDFSARQDAAFAQVRSMAFDSRKALAEAVMKTECPPCLFALADRKAGCARDWLLLQPVRKALGYVGLGDADMGKEADVG